MIEAANSNPMDLPGQTSALPSESASESRFDPMTGRWTIFAPDREQRPEEYVATESINRDLQCPFCVGQESLTPKPVWVGRIGEGSCEVDIDDRSTPDWSVRVVPNRYPAVRAIEPTGEGPASNSLFQRRTVYGGHEVFVETRQHQITFSRLDPAEVQLVFLAYRDRLRHWRSQPGIQYLSAFKNSGEKAGASLRHAHSQLIATDVMPEAITRSIDLLTRHRAKTGCCLQCDLIRQECKAQHRVVWQNDSLIAFCPFASRLPMTLRITTLEHQGCFEDLEVSTIEAVSRIVHRAIGWLGRIHPGAAFNYCIYTRPPGVEDSSDSYHWAIDVFPRITQMAGFEWGSGCVINTVLPETAANAYRKKAIAEDPRLVL